MIGGNALRVAFGAAVSGVSSVLVLGIAARAFPGAAFASFSSWWTVAVLGGLVFTVLETYLPNARSATSERGLPADQASAVIARRGAMGVAALSLAVAATAPWSGQYLFRDQLWLPVLLVPEIIFLAAQSVQRGEAVACGVFRTVTVQYGVDGVARIVLGLLAWVIGVASPVVFASIMLVSALLGLGCGWLFGGRFLYWDVGNLRLPWRPMLSLFIAGLGPVMIMNVPTPWLVAQPNLDPFAVGGYVGATALSRVPTMFAGALYGPVLNPLLTTRQRRDHHAFCRILRLSVAGALTLAVLLVIASFVLGPTLVRLLVGPDYPVTRTVTTLLMCAGTQVLLTGVLSAGLAALHSWSVILLSWTAGMVSLTIVLALGPALEVDALATATAAPLAAATVASTIMSVQLVRGVG